MRKLIFPVVVFLSCQSQAQTDTTKWLRAFPITDYMVELDDSTKVVQVEMPDGHVLKEKQPGFIYGVYNGSKDKAVQRGYGRCHLIKSNYYYFSITLNKSGLPLEKGDLLYTMMDITPVYYGRIPKIAAHFIRLQNVYEAPLFDRYSVFSNWTEKDEKNIVDSMVVDIRFTGKHFSENDPSMDVLITSGEHKGKKTFYMMMQTNPVLVHQFLDYVIARPRLYAGKEWKISEIFATWLSEGAPTVVKD
jgi:hypothetical protein